MRRKGVGDKPSFRQQVSAVRVKPKESTLPLALKAFHQGYLREIRKLEREIKTVREEAWILADELQKRKQAFETVAENAPDIICRFDKNFYLIYVNPAIEKATGLQQKSFFNKTPYQVGMPDSFAAMWEKNFLLVMKTGTPTTIEFTFPSPVGEKYFQSLLVPEFDTEGNVETVLSISRDITQIRQQQKKKDEFIGIVSHELKTPVTSLKMYAQFLHKKLIQKGDNGSAGHLERMNYQLDKLTGLIGDLLDVTKIGGGKLQFRDQQFVFDELVEETVSDLQRITLTHTLVIDGKSKQTIVADRYRIGQVLTNFLSNAIKYSPKASQIVVKCWADKTHVFCMVQDFGMGIPPEKQGKVFEQFFRVTEFEADTYPGLGLGLYIAANIIRRQNGKIWVESEEGKGSKFYFSLPLTSQ